jgi:hypothetical protein
MREVLGACFGDSSKKKSGSLPIFGLLCPAVRIIIRLLSCGFGSAALYSQLPRSGTRVKKQAQSRLLF